MSFASPYRLLLLHIGQDNFLFIPTPQILGWHYGRHPKTRAPKISVQLSAGHMELPKIINPARRYAELLAGKYTVEATELAGDLKKLACPCDK